MLLKMSGHMSYKEYPEENEMKYVYFTDLYYHCRKPTIDKETYIHERIATHLLVDAPIVFWEVHIVSLEVLKGDFIS